jgi:hypothetical protein
MGVFSNEITYYLFSFLFTFVLSKIYHYRRCLFFFLYIAYLFLLVTSPTCTKIYVEGQQWIDIIRKTEIVNKFLRVQPIPSGSTKFRVPMYWESLSKVPDMGTSKILSNYTDVGIASGTHNCMFTEQVLAWVPAPVTLLR